MYESFGYFVENQEAVVRIPGSDVSSHDICDDLCHSFHGQCK